MPGAKLPILTITNKQYYRDDGLYIYSSTDGQLDIIADTTAKVTAPTCELEASTGITLDGNITFGDGHTLTASNDGTLASSNIADAGRLFGVAFTSGAVTGLLKVTVGGEDGYIPMFSGNSVTTAF